jgi:hypothetical protein
MSSAVSHKFRDESAKAPQSKVKCQSCGCWAKRGGNCYFCKAPTPSSVPSATSASQSLARRPSGMSLTTDSMFKSHSLSSSALGSTSSSRFDFQPRERSASNTT